MTMPKAKHKPHKKHETPLINEFERWLDEVRMAPNTIMLYMLMLRLWRDWL